jgi:putative DNA primase/helicase
MTAENIAKALGGRKAGTAWIAPCPAHEDSEPSLSIRDAEGGKLLVHCHAGCDQSQVIAELRSHGLWHENNDRTRRYSQPAAPARPPRGQLVESDSVLNRRRAAALWQNATPIAATIAAKYLATRRILHLAADIDGKVLRFHPLCPYDGSRHPCLLALMRDVGTNEPRAIQRTALTQTGEKIGRRTLGPKTGAAIKFSPDEHVTIGLAVGEGIETMLSAMQLGFSPAWALGDAGNVRAFPVLSGVECLTIIVDNDESGTGQRAALDCSSRWTGAGHEVIRVIPDRRGDDMNNIVQRAVA